MGALTWTDSDGDTARLMAFREFAGPELGDGNESALLVALPGADRVTEEAIVCIETRAQAEAIIAWLRDHFGIRGAAGSFRSECERCGAVRVGIAHDDGRWIELRIDGALADCSDCRAWWESVRETARLYRGRDELPSYESFLP